MNLFLDLMLEIQIIDQSILFNFDSYSYQFLGLKKNLKFFSMKYTYIFGGFGVVLMVFIACIENNAS